MGDTGKAFAGVTGAARASADEALDAARLSSARLGFHTLRTAHNLSVGGKTDNAETGDFRPRPRFPGKPGGLCRPCRRRRQDAFKCSNDGHIRQHPAGRAAGTPAEPGWRRRPQPPSGPKKCENRVNTRRNARSPRSQKPRTHPSLDLRHGRRCRRRAARGQGAASTSAGLTTTRPAVATLVGVADERTIRVRRKTADCSAPHGATLSAPDPRGAKTPNRAPVGAGPRASELYILGAAWGLAAPPRFPRLLMAPRRRPSPWREPRSGRIDNRTVPVDRSRRPPTVIQEDRQHGP